MDTMLKVICFYRNQSFRAETSSCSHRPTGNGITFAKEVCKRKSTVPTLSAMLEDNNTSGLIIHQTHADLSDAVTSVIVTSTRPDR